MSVTPRELNDAVPVVYNELRRLAAAHLAQEPTGQTLSPTSLVHEAYLRLAALPSWESDRHFFNAAALAMRRILVDRVRAKRAEKRGGKLQRVDLDSIIEPSETLDILGLDEALTTLSEVDPQAAELVQLRFFASRTRDEAAAMLNISPRQADRVWAFARAWLYDHLSNI